MSADRNGTGYSVFTDTMADMTYPEVAEAAERGAVVLWALGVIEQHGPHLPLATDVYVPMAVLRQAKALLAERGIESIIAPPFYWGINAVSSSFPGSIKVRAPVMIELIKDVFASLGGDGFRRIFCLSGHGDAQHNRTIYDGIVAGCGPETIEGHFVLAPVMRDRLELDPADPRLVTYGKASSGTPGNLDIHAGESETSVLLHECMEACRCELIPGLRPTNLGMEDLKVWRQGGKQALKVTPMGYFGDPAAATAEKGREFLRQNAASVADAIERTLRAPA
ncbi:creatininase family protein [Pararoseomonas indoligenes]|uniref:Creatininase family protein n=1 Tax=Roseomonas indoligenes TaxID=2820811 RepID=A0A940MT87_9PROT|nr:creatininase family protein [Pararoseomonas indoligenes]MBP0491496.1 creatininase family protein [Pararoseomonas indoligenes]